MSALYETVISTVSDSRAAAIVTESTYSPANGIGKPIAPPTYAGDDREAATFAYTEHAYVPVSDENGWHTQIRRDADRRPQTAAQVVVNSVQAESGRAEEATWTSPYRLDFELPGIVVEPPKQEVIERAITEAIKKVKAGPEMAGRIQAEVSAVLRDFEVSTWTLAHRQADAWIKYAANPDGTQVWEGGEVKDRITEASARNADLLYSYFVNAGAYGMWLSSGVARRHRIPRAYSSEIVGYEARPIRRAATKLDAAGGAAKGTALTMKDGKLIEGKGHKPSDLGFGQVPTSPRESAFECALILQQASISLPVFRSFRFSEDSGHEKRTAAAAVFALLAVVGHELAAEDSFLRAECSLVRESARWGVRRSSSTGAAGIEDIDVPDADTAITALREAVEAAEAVGLSFAPRTTIALSPVQTAVVAERVARELAKTTGSDE